VNKKKADASGVDFLVKGANFVGPSDKQQTIAESNRGDEAHFVMLASDPW
jgi:hypothetical protein